MKAIYTDKKYLKSIFEQRKRQDSSAKQNTCRKNKEFTFSVKEEKINY